MKRVMPTLKAALVIVILAATLATVLAEESRPIHDQKITAKLIIMTMFRKELSTLQFEAEDHKKCTLNKTVLSQERCARIHVLIQKTVKSDLKSETHPAVDGALYKLTFGKKTVILGEFLDEACEI